MPDERKLLSRLQRIPAAPDRIIELQDFTLKPDSADDFESIWHDFAIEQAHQAGCIFVRLHRDTEYPAHYVSYALWKSRRALVNAMRALPDEPAYPIMGEPHRTYVRTAIHVRGSQADAALAKPGQVASLRGFHLRVRSEPRFEQLWATSARSESHQRGCLYKRLHRDLNLPTHYISYSLWADSAAPNEAASKHAHWQGQHEPYPLAGPVIRVMLEVREHILGTEAKK